MQVNRRDFFRTLFGATVVALVPEPVMRAIEEVPPPPIAKPPVEVKPEDLFNFPNKCLFIYDGNDRLLGYSYDFAVNLERDLYLLPEEEEFVEGWKRWYIEVPKINSTGEMEYMVFTDALSRGGKLKAVFVYDKIKFVGDVYLTEASLSYSAEDQQHACSLAFVGSGALTKEI